MVKVRSSEDDYYFMRMDVFNSENPACEKGGVVFLGDSLTERFPLKNYFAYVNVVNRGIGGDKIDGGTTYDVFERLNESVYCLAPSVLFILIGVNDIIFFKPELNHLMKKYAELVERISEKLPGCKIIMQSLLPVCGQFTEFNGKIKEMNAMLKKYAADKKITLVDLNPSFCDDNGLLKEELTEDGIHLSKAGYDVWAEKIRVFVEKQK